MGFWLAAGPSQEVKFCIKIFENDQLIEEIFPQLLPGSCLGVATAETTKRLKTKTKYIYHCLADDMPLFEGHFFTLSDAKEFPFYFLSCNGISYHEWKDPKADAWKVWKILQEEVELEIAPSLLFMCGDQAYMDLMFQEDIKNIEKISAMEIWRKIYSAYYDHWKDFSYLKVLGQIPSYMMGDDHDFLDGFGSREEQFDINGETENWQFYRKFIIQAFWEMQAVRNGERPVDNFLWQKKIGNSHFIMPDLRTERNFLKHQILSNAQKESLEKYVTANVAAGESLYFISTVTFGRMSKLAELLMSNLANYLWRLNSWLGRDSSFKKVFWSMTLTLFFAGSSNSLYSFFFFSWWWLISETGKGKSDFHPLIHKVLTSVATAAVVISGAKLFYLSEKPSFEPFSGMFVISLGLVGLFSYCGNFFKNFNHLERVKIFAAIAAVFLIATLFIKFNFFVLFFALLTMLEGLGIVDLFASADDDMKDAWSAEVNSGELTWLANYFSAVIQKGARVFFLTGDIHTGGVASFTLKKHPLDKIYHLISSPVAYFSMSSFAERLTSATKIISLPWKKPVLDFKNEKYFHKRHFAQFIPGKDPVVEFTFEDGSRQRFVLSK